MAIRYAKQYTNQSEYIYDLAKSTGKFDEQTYASLVKRNKADDYASAVANTKYMTSDTFDQKTYDLLAGEAKYNYLLNEYYVDKSSEDYLKNKQYLDLEIQKAVDAKTFDSLNGFEKTMATIGGVVGNAINELVGGTVEGLVDVLWTAVGAVGSVFNADFGEAVKQWVAEDFTGVAAIRNDLARFNRAYTYIDKNGFAKGVNDVVTGIAKMAPLLLPYAGTAIYFGGMAGNVAEEAIIQNPDINYGNLVLYTGAVTAAEFGIEKISAGMFGGSAIDNLMFKTSGSKAGSWWGRIGLDFLSEGMEESIAEFADSVLYTALVDNNAPIASIQDILYAGLIGGIIGGIGAGGRIMSTSRLGITKDGVLIDTKSLTKEQRKSFEGKILGKAQTLTLQERLQNIRNAMDSNAITDLQAKYKNLTLDEIKTQHADEYQKALDKNVKFQTDLNEAAIALAKILDLIGEKNFIKATELANYTAEQTRTAVSNYLNRTTATTAANRAVELKYAIKNPGSSLKINDTLTTEQQRLKNAIKKLYNIDTFFGDLGFKDGIKKKNGLTLDDKTIVIDSTVSNRMSLNDVINEVVKEELGHALQYNKNILDASTINDLNEQYTGKLGGKISGVKAKSEYKGEQLLTQISENQAKFLAESLLFDELTISRIFITNNSTFSKVYKWLNSRKEAIEQKKNRKTNKDKVEYRILLQTMETYRKSAANAIGNTEDADAVASELNLTDEQYQKLIDTFVPDFSNQHYTLLGKNYTIHTERRMKAEKFLSDNRKIINKNLPIMWRNVYNPEYYEDSFVEKIMSRNPEEDFRYNLQEYMITTYGFTINDVDNCLMEIVDFNKVITKDFDNDLEDLIADPNSLDKYETADQIFRPTFKNKFKGALKDVDIKFIKISTDQSTKAQYIPRDPETGRATIKVYIKEGVTFTPSQIGVLRHNIFHELTHALGDIQGLQNGTSTNYVKSALLEIKDDKIINRLANLLLTKEYRAANKNNKRELIDAIAYGIYRITDGEYAAESYPDSATRKGELEVALKAGATMNRSGFRTDGRVLYGYGRFSGIVLEAKTITQSKLEFDVKGLRRAFDVVSYSLENTLLKSLEEQGITDFEEAGFSDEFIYDILENPEATIDAVWDKINKNSVGTPEATNKIINWLAPNNKNIKTIEDVERVTEMHGLAYGKIVRAQILKTNPNYDTSKKHSYIKLQNKVDSMMSASKRNYDILSKDIEKTSNLLGKTTNETINKYIIETDFDYSFDAINNLYKRVASQYGLDASRAQELITRQTSEGKELNLAEQESQYGVEESPEDKLIRAEEQAEDKRTIVDKTKESFENFKQSLKEWLTTDQQNIMGKKANEASALLESLDKLSKSELKDDPEISSLIEDMKTGKFLKDIVQETMSDENAFAIKNKIGRNTATLKTIFGENYLKDSGLSEILPKTKQNYKRDINKEITRLKDTELTKEQQKLVNKDLSTLRTPNDFENHLARLQELSSKLDTQLKVDAIISKAVDTSIKTGEETKIEQKVSDETKNRTLKILKEVDNIDSDETISTEDAKSQEKSVKNLSFTENEQNKVKQLLDMLPEADESEYQGDFEDPKVIRVHQKTIDANLSFFESITADELQAMIKLLRIDFDDVRSTSALNMLARYAYDHRNDQFVSIKEFIKRFNKQRASESGSFLGGLSATYGTRAVKSFVEDVAIRENVEITLPETILTDALKKYNGSEISVEDFTKTLQNDLDELLKQRKNTKDPFKKYELTLEIRKKSKLLDSLSDGDIAKSIDAITEILLDEDTNQTENLEKIHELYTEIITAVTNSNNLKKKYNKNASILSPEAKKKITNFLTGVKSFRYMAMLSSPITAGKNALSNTMSSAQAIIEDSLVKGFENSKWLSQGSQGRFTGNYDKAFSDYVTEKYLPLVLKATEGDRYTTSEFNKLEQQYAEAANPLNKNKITKGVLDVEKKMLSDQQWTTRRTLRNLKNMLAGSAPQIYNQAYNWLATKYHGKDSTKTTITYDQLYKNIKETNPELAELFKQATSGDVLSILKLGEELNVELLNDKDNPNSIFNVALKRSNKLLLKIDNKLTRMISYYKRHGSFKAKVAINVLELFQPFVRVSVNSTMYILDRSPIGLVKGLFKALQTKSAYRADMVELIQDYYKAEFNKQQKEKNKDYKFKQADYENWFTKNVPENVKDAILNSRKMYKELSSIYNNMVNEGKIMANLVGINDPWMRATAFEQISQGTIGTAIMTLGIILAAALDVFDYDDDDDYLGPVIRIGDFKMGINDLAPFNTMFTMGAMLGSGKIDDNIGAALGVFIDSSILSTIDSAITYSDGLLDLFGNQLINTTQQYIPAISKNIIKSTYNAKKDKSGNWGMRFLKTLGSNSLVFNWLVPNKINPYTGETVKYYEGGWFEQLLGTISPISMRYEPKSELQREAEKLNSKTSGASGSYTINGKNYKTSDKEKEKLAKFRANYINKEFEKISNGTTKVTIKDSKTGKFKTTTYDRLTEEQKAKVLENLYSKASEITKIYYWISSGNTYISTDRDTYNEYRNAFSSSNKIIYRQNWNKSKFVEG